MDIPRPTTEEECAAICDYKYLRKNHISYRLLREQQRYICQDRGMAQVTSPRCDCKLINHDGKCEDDSCDNRCNNTSCEEGCGEFCRNCPWESTNYGFVAGKDTYLVIDDLKGAAIFANKVIREKTFIGEFTGHVRRLTDNYSEKDMEYCVKIGETGQIIVGKKLGSIVTRINHSCNPNCKAYLYQHEGHYKVVYVANKLIQQDEELTIDYGWKFEKGKETHLTECWCGIGGFHYIEKQSIQKPRNLSLSQCTFQSVLPDADLDMSVLPKHRPDSYKEIHVFQPREDVFLITSNRNGILQATGGRVSECYINRHNIPILVVRTSINGRINHHVPRWICFKFAEDASFRILNYTKQDRDRLQDYTYGMASFKKADNLSDNLVIDYVMSWIHGDPPKLKQVDNDVDRAGYAIGMLNRVLVPDQTLVADNDDDSGHDDYEFPIENMLEDWDYIEADETDGHFIIPCGRQVTCEGRRMDSCTEEEEEENGRHLGWKCCAYVRQGNKYISKFRRNFRELCDNVESAAHFQRMLESAIENVAIYALARIPKQRGVTYFEMQQTIRRELEYIYLQAPPKDRHFLRFTHYSQAVEIVHPGSWQLRWCSLCRLTHTFESEHEMREHYNNRHAIVPKTYVCPECRYGFLLPSEFLDHVDCCCSSVSAICTSRVGYHVLDAYWEYSMAKASGQITNNILKQGIPSRFEDTVPQSKQRTQMNLFTDKPIDSNITLHPARMILDFTSNVIMSGWNFMQRHLNKKAAPRIQKPVAITIVLPNHNELVIEDAVAGTEHEMVVIIPANPKINNRGD